MANKEVETISKEAARSLIEEVSLTCRNRWGSRKRRIMKKGNHKKEHEKMRIMRRGAPWK
jgi:hypothetical protein